MKTIKESKIGKTTFRLVDTGKSIAGLAFLDDKIICKVEGKEEDEVWEQLQLESAHSNPGFVGFGGAINRFSSFFPEGFSSAAYIDNEREYKIVAKELLDSTVPLEAAVNGSGFGEAINAVFNKTNLVSPFEKMRLKDVLRSNRADQFVRGAAQLALGDIKSGLNEMEKALTPDNAAKWTTVTYLPFLWRPEEHMFLKPTVTNNFAERIGHSFHDFYVPQLNSVVYESLLDLARTTDKNIQELSPQDRIDIQSFIWVVGEYTESELPIS